MEKKAFALFASPREESNSEALGAAVCRGLESEGVSVVRRRFRDLAVAPCTACDYCRAVRLTKALAGEKRFCSIKDDMEALYGPVAGADILVLASPVYSFSVSAQLKIFIDRLYALWREGEEDGLAGKEIILALTYGDEDVFHSGGVNAIRSVQDLATFYRMGKLHILHARADKPGETEARGELLQKGFDLGASVAGGSGLSGSQTEPVR